MTLTLVDTAMSVHRHPAAAAVQRSTRDKLADIVSVKDFGAIGDGSSHPLSSRYATLEDAQARYPFATALTDQIDWAAWQAAANYAVEAGTSIRVPAGQYVINRTVTIDTSGAASQFSHRPDVLGDGANTTSIQWIGGDSVCLWFKGPENNSASGALHAYSVLSGLRIGKSIDTLEGIAIRVDNHAFWQVNGVVVADGWGDCIYGTDVLSSAFYSCVFRGGRRGMTFSANRTTTDGDFESNPNNLNLYSCTFGNLSEYAVWQVGGSGFNMYGGSIEGIGLGGTGTRWGIKLDKAGREGSVGCNINGTYFENNNGVADVWIDQPDAVAGDINYGGTGVAYNFTAVNFHRVSSADFTTNNIRIDTQNFPFALGVYGCGFRGAGSYAASVDRQCIQVHPLSGRGWSASVDPGNYFSHDVDRPTWTRQPTFISYLHTDQSLPIDASNRLDFRRYDDIAASFSDADNAFVAPFRVRMAFSAHVQINGLPEGAYIALEMRVNGNLVATDQQHVNAAGYSVVARPLKLALAYALNRGDKVTWHVVQNSSGSPIAWSGLTGTWVEGYPA